MERSLAKVQRSCGRTMTLQGARKSCQSNERGAPLKSFEKCAHGPQGCILTRADVQTCPVLLSTSQAQPGRAFSQLSDLSFAPHCKLGRQEADLRILPATRLVAKDNLVAPPVQNGYVHAGADGQQVLLDSRPHLLGLQSDSLNFLPLHLFPSDSKSDFKPLRII